MFDWLFNKTFSSDVNSTQLYIRDDYSFFFRPLKVYDGFMTEGSKDKPKAKWPLFHKLQFPFEGYRNISAGRVSIGFSKDIFYDPHETLEKNEKPVKGPGLDKTWIKDRATSQVYKHQLQKAKGLLMDKVTIGLAIVLVLMGLAFFITKVTN